MNKESLNVHLDGFVGDLAKEEPNEPRGLTQTKSESSDEKEPRSKQEWFYQLAEYIFELRMAKGNTNALPEIVEKLESHIKTNPYAQGERVEEELSVIKEFYVSSKEQINQYIDSTDAFLSGELLVLAGDKDKKNDIPMSFTQAQNELSWLFKLSEESRRIASFPEGAKISDQTFEEIHQIIDDRPSVQTTERELREEILKKRISNRDALILRLVANKRKPSEAAVVLREFIENAAGEINREDRGDSALEGMVERIAKRIAAKSNAPHSAEARGTIQHEERIRLEEQKRKELIDKILNPEKTGDAQKDERIAEAARALKEKIVLEQGKDMELARSKLVEVFVKKVNEKKGLKRFFSRKSGLKSTLEQSQALSAYDRALEKITSTIDSLSVERQLDETQKQELFADWQSKEKQKLSNLAREEVPNGKDDILDELIERAYFGIDRVYRTHVSKEKKGDVQSIS